jgi:parallel beta-helix repeat protein
MKRIHMNFRLSIIVLAMVILLSTLFVSTVPVSASVSADNGLGKAALNAANPNSLIIVAASDSSAQDKKSANYKCDGKNDQNEIQSAVKKLPAAGGIVQLVAGTYYLSSQVNVVDGKNNVTIQGTGDTTILKSVGNILMLLRIRLVDGVTVQNLVLDGSSQAKGRIGAAIIDTGYVTHLTVNDVVAANGGYYGISLYSSNDSVIEGCITYNNYDDGIHPGSDNAKWGYRNKILNNTCYKNGMGIKDRGNTAGILPLNTEISGNTCYDNKEYGILLSNQSGSVITNSECYSNGRSGIQVHSVSNININQNKCYNNGQKVKWSCGINVFTASTNINVNITGNQLWDDQVAHTQKDGVGYSN